MSKFADSSKAHVWLDGDAFRAPAGTELPADPWADDLTGWDAYGGIEVGFEATAEQNIDRKKIFNKRDAAYKIIRDALDQGVKFRAVDNTKATLLTRAQGGKVTKVGQNHILEVGKGEEFAIFIRLDDGAAKTGFYCPRATLAAPATRAAIDGQNIDGFDFDVAYLETPKELIPALPDGVSI